MFGVGEDAKVSTRQANIFTSVERIFESSGAAVPSVKATAWLAYNAVNEHLAYQRGRSADTRLDSLWFGEAANIDRRALELAIAMAC